MNYDGANQHLKLYEELINKKPDLINEAIKTGLEVAANYSNKRNEWVSGLNPNFFEAEENYEFDNITDDALKSFYERGQERMKTPAEDEKSWEKNFDRKISGLAQSLPMKPSTVKVGQASIKRKYEEFENNTTHDSIGSKPPTNFMNNKPEWKPKSNSSFQPPDNSKKFESDRTLWSNSATAKRPIEQPVRKYTSNVPPMKQHAPSNHNKMETSKNSDFRSARDELISQNIKKYGHSGGASSNNQAQNSFIKKSLGTARKSGAFGKFVAPKRIGEEREMYDTPEESNMEVVDERLRNIEPQMIEKITNEIMYVGKPVQWDDIAGLESAKSTIQEIVIWPLLRPDIFNGLREPPKGILLFGPPGTGKTLIGKCIAAQSKATFFSISASSLTSKWIGEGEKMVRALFAVARCEERAVIFIDEIDSLLSQRSDSEHESSRRIKTEFLVQLDGATTADDERVLIVGATNRPQELDEAARRRLVKRLYIPLPDSKARAQMVHHLMGRQNCTLSEEDVEMVATMADGFSGADMLELCREASYGPIRSIAKQVEHIDAKHVRAINIGDFENALKQVRPSVSQKDLQIYEEWNKTYGYGG